MPIMIGTRQKTLISIFSEEDDGEDSNRRREFGMSDLSLLSKYGSVSDRQLNVILRASV